VVDFAASSQEFYQRQFQRGMAHFSTGDYAVALTELRNAAFGLVENVEAFETAQTYAALAAHRLGHAEDTRDALIRIVAAEEVQPHFRSIKLTDDLRLEIDTLAAGLLTREEAKTLGIPESLLKSVAREPTVAVPTPSKAPNVAVTAPREKGGAETAPRSTEPLPVAPQPSTRDSADPPAQPAAPVSRPAPENAETSLAEAQWALCDGDLARARSIYNTLLRSLQLSHSSALQLAEGLYFVGDFAAACLAFQRTGPFKKGEESNHYYYAVALYETGQYADARRELAAALPFIAPTPDIARHRAEIEGAPK
jgi:hypothetical protein